MVTTRCLRKLTTHLNSKHRYHGDSLITNPSLFSELYNSAMQRTINEITETIFPGVQVFVKDEKKVSNKDFFTSSLTSSLPLQMALYFNAFYFPCWIFITVVMLNVKYAYLDPVFQVVLILVVTAASIIEVIRLYAGHLGNLFEMIPELAGFWILSLLLQLPIQVFLLFNEGIVILPMERAVNIIMLGFVIFELIIGYIAIKKKSNHLAAKFNLETFNLPKLSTNSEYFED